MYFHHVIHLVSAASGTHNTGAAGVMSESICCVSWSTGKQTASLVGISEVCVFCSGIAIACKRECEQNLCHPGNIDPGL